MYVSPQMTVRSNVRFNVLVMPENVSQMRTTITRVGFFLLASEEGVVWSVGFL